MRIGPKIYLVVIGLGMVAMVLGIMGVSAMRTYNAKVEEIAEASHRAIIGEQVNGLILAVVMDSRGVYMSRDRAEAEKFGKPLLASLRQMEAKLTEWKALLPASQAEAFAKAEGNARQFIEFRAELVRIGYEQGNPAARDYGDNDANRKNRQALNTEMQALAADNNQLIGQLQSDLTGYYNSRVEILIALAVAGVLAALTLAVFVTRRFITRPIASLITTMTRLAAGNTDEPVPGVGRKDEIGAMAATVQVFKDNMIRGDHLAAEQSTEQNKKAARQDALEAAIHEFEKSVSGALQRVSMASGELQMTARSMSSTAEETQRQSSAVANASELASTNVQTVASAAEQLSASIGEIGRQVAESSAVTSQAVGEAERTNAEIQGLAVAAQSIGDVVKLINDIASQTNLLALNATIEAARAGDAGKGFAVVASEVKNLANQTARATDEISVKIAEMQAATEQSVQVVRGIGSTMARIDQIASTIAAAVEEQGSATQEIARNVQQASNGTSQVSSNILNVTRAANDSGSAATQVLQASDGLTRESEHLRVQVADFIARVRAV